MKRKSGDLRHRDPKVGTYTDYTENIAVSYLNKLYNEDIEDKKYEPPDLFGELGRILKPK